jgi:hypothetical protein
MTATPAGTLLAALARATPLPAMDRLASTATLPLELTVLLVQVALDRPALRLAHTDRLQPVPTALTWPTVLILALTLTTAALAAQTLALWDHLVPQLVLTAQTLVQVALDRPALRPELTALPEQAVMTTLRATMAPRTLRADLTSLTC